MYAVFGVYPRFLHFEGVQRAPEVLDPSQSLWLWLWYDDRLVRVRAHFGLRWVSLC